MNILVISAFLNFLGPKPCTYLEVTSKAGISKQYPEYLGVFEREKESSDQAGRGVYLKSNGIALWWSNQVGTWKVKILIVQFQLIFFQLIIKYLKLLHRTMKQRLHFLDWKQEARRQ